MLTAVSGGTTVTFTYDPIGRLNTTAVPTSTTFLYDSDRLVAEFDASGAVLRRYVHGPGVDEPIIWYEGAGTTDRRWLHQDRQGSVIAWSDGSGTVSASTVYKYGPWGEPGDNWASGASRFRYTGQIAIPEARLYYYKARMYDPVTGRFMQTDPIGYEDDLDLYAYVGGDPVNRSDPSGLCPLDSPVCETANAAAGRAAVRNAPPPPAGTVGVEFEVHAELGDPNAGGVAISGSISAVVSSDGRGNAEPGLLATYGGMLGENNDTQAVGGGGAGAGFAGVVSTGQKTSDLLGESDRESMVVGTVGGSRSTSPTATTSSVAPPIVGKGGGLSYTKFKTNTVNIPQAASDIVKGAVNGWNQFWKNAPPLF